MICQSSTKYDPKNSLRTSFGLFSAKYDLLRPIRQCILSRVLNNFVDDQPSVQCLTFYLMSSKEADLHDPSREDLFNIIRVIGNASGIHRGD
ncbi:hypothetical protein Hanom_Chr01g00057281 [Helianthus anomalus]